MKSAGNMSGETLHFARQNPNFAAQTPDDQH